MNEGKKSNRDEEWFVQQLKEKDAIIDGISDVLMVLDAENYKILEVNQAFLNLYGTSREAVFGKTCYDITHLLNIPCHHANQHCPCPLEDTVTTGEASLAEHMHHDHEGQTLYFEIITYPLKDSRGRVTRCIHLSRDITRRKNLETQYHQLALQTEKMSAMGRMAAGIAHEINNPLAGVLLYSTNMMKKVPEEGPLKDGLEVIIHETLRCRTIIQELLEFSREREPQKISVNINDIVEKSLRILDNEFRLRHISVEKHLSREMPDILLDANQMEQVFINLLLNAIEATEEKGRITVQSYIDPDEKQGMVEISDTGCGIPEENISKVFEPFFSTKAKGTGLGLAVSYGIVRNHQGDIKVSSQPGQGTCFTIEIPLSE